MKKKYFKESYFNMEPRLKRNKIILKNFSVLF